MAGDYTRLTFDPRRDRAMVLEQQGRVHLDADWNELVAILERRLRVETYDFAGPAVVPASEPDSFKIVVQGGALAVTRGRIYVDGLLAENHGAGAAGYEPVWGESTGSETTPLDEQPYLGSPEAGAQLLKALRKGNALAYLDVWQRELTAVEDPTVVEPALGVDTCTRIQTVWLIRALALDRDAPSCGDDWSTYGPWTELTAPSAARLTTAANQPPAPADPCAVAPVGGYRGTENRLYRVEVHDGGGAGDVTIKWSRDNGAVASRIVGAIADATTKPVVPLERLGRDDVLRFAPTDWVELLDDEHELDGRPGIVAQVDSVDQAQQTVTLTAPLVGTVDENRNPRIRRWDQTAGLTNGVVPVTFETPIALEDGIEVTLTLADPNGEAHTGDWWVFAARAATASLEELDAAPPRGIRHHYARLAILQRGKIVDDCRVVFPGECRCEGDCACTVCVTPQSHGDDDGPLTIQNAIDQVVKAGGGHICLTTGSYVLKRPLRIDGARALTLAGEGEGTVISYVGDGLGIAVLNSVDVVLEDFALAVARASDREFAATRERAREAFTGHLTLTNVPSFATAPVGEQTIAIALVNTAACRVERCFVVSGFAPGAATSGFSVNGSLGIGLGGWSIRTRVADNIVFGDVAIGDLTVGRAGVKTAFAYDHVGLGTSYSTNVDLEIADNLLLALSAGIDFGSLPPRPGGAKAGASRDALIGPSLHVGLTRIVDNLVIGPRTVGIGLVGTAGGGFRGAEPVDTGTGEGITGETATVDAPRVARSNAGLARAQATHSAAASLVLLGEVLVRGLNRIDIVGNVLDLSGAGIVSSPGNVRIEGNDITGEASASRLGRGGGILLTLGSARLGRTVIADNGIRAVTGYGIAWSGAPGRLDVRGNRLAGVTGYGIAGSINSRPDVVTIADNTIEDVLLDRNGLAFGVQAAGALIAEIRANRVSRVGTSGIRAGRRAGILVSGCRTTSVTDNVLFAIGSAGERAGLVYGIGYGGTLEVLDIRGNIVELGRGAGGQTVALAVTEAVWRPGELGAAELGATDHLTLFADVVRSDNPSVLDPAFERARVVVTKAFGVHGEGSGPDPVPPGAGDVAIVDNTLRSSSATPLALIDTTANLTFAQNRLARAGNLVGTPGVLAQARGAVIVSSNRVETAKARNAPASIALSVDTATKGEPHCTVLGNITSRPILLNNSSLQAPWAALNIVA
jgi:Family of unknown function (DUF6519)/Right handed beta helix region